MAKLTRTAGLKTDKTVAQAAVGAITQELGETGAGLKGLRAVTDLVIIHMEELEVEEEVLGVRELTLRGPVLVRTVVREALENPRPFRAPL